MRIAIYVHGYLPHLPAGSETMLHEMALPLAARGHEVKAFTVGFPARSTSWTHEGVRVTNRLTEDQAELLVAAWRPDVIVSHHGVARRAIPLARQIGAKVAAIVHNDFHWSDQIVKLRPDLLVANTAWIAAKVIGHRHRDLRTIVIHPPVDPARHRTDPGDMITMINMTAMKGPATFWRMVYKFPEYKFLAVKGAYGTQELRNAPNCEIIETTRDMRADVWSRTRILLVPSKYESYGKGPVEAAASGIPAIVAPTPGLREAMGGGASMIPRINPAAWEDRIRALMTDPAEWERASAAARARSDQIEAARPAELTAWADAIEALPLPR